MDSKRSPVYPVPNIITSRSRARGGLLRNRDGVVDQAFPGDGELTAKELERRIVEEAHEQKIPQDERHINIITE